jgi:hypothetical protein
VIQELFYGHSLIRNMMPFLLTTGALGACYVEAGVRIFPTALYQV